MNILDTRMTFGHADQLQKHYKVAGDAILFDKLLKDMATLEIKYNDNLVSPSKTIEALKNHSNATTIKSLFKFLYETPRSKVMTGAMSKNPQFGAFTPLWMYAFKREHNIPYEKWDKQDPKIAWFLLLPELLEFLKAYPKPIEIDTELRPLFVTDSKDKVHPYTVYKFNNAKNVLDNFDLVKNKKIGMMLYQIWLANHKLRVPEVMILDPWNWDNTPEAIEDDIIEEAKVSKEPKVTNELEW